MNWYSREKRDLPWRATRNPYMIWLSEIILQQTRVAQGTPYYEKFMKRYGLVLLGDWGKLNLLFKNLFSKKKNTDVTTAAKANPLEAHSLDTLDELGDKVVGKGFKKMRQGYELTPKQIEKSIKLLQNMTR